MGSRWADELNQRVAAYLEAGGLEVVGVTSRGQWAAAVVTFAFTILAGVLPQYFINQSVDAAKRFPVYTQQPRTPPPPPGP